MHKLIVFVILLAVLITLPSLSFAVCNGQATHPIPAVVGDGGGLVDVNLKIVNGRGNVYLTTYPRTGVATQESIDNAVFYISSKYDASLNKDCDVLVNINGDLAEYVDGPSGGVAFSVLTFAALNNLHIREDSAVTGAVDKFGNVGSVGGLYEKAKGISRSKMKYFLTPPLSIHERVLLASIKKSSNLQIKEIYNADDAIGFLVFNKTIEQKPLTSKDRSLPDLPAYDSFGLEEFKNLIKDLKALEKTSLNNINSDDNDIKDIKKIFTEELDRQDKLTQKGYLFSAANEAFLDYIDASTIAGLSNPDKVNLNKKAYSINTCLGNLPEYKKTDTNFEWIIGSDLRKNWALQKLGSLDLENQGLAEQKYYLFNEIMYAQAWCDISASLAKASLDFNGGNEIDESFWKDIAKKRLMDAENRNITDKDTLSHLQSAKILFDNGKYGAAAFDAVFVSSMADADNAVSSSSGSSGIIISGNINKLKDLKLNSLWARIYQSQGVFLAETGDQASAYHILKYAQNLDNLVSDFNGENPNAKSFSSQQNPKNTDMLGDVAPFPNSRVRNDIKCLPGFIFIFICSIIYFRRRKIGFN